MLSSSKYRPNIRHGKMRTGVFNSTRTPRNFEILNSEETRLLVSIFTYRYIDAMLLNLEAPVPQQTKRKNFNLSVLKNFIKFLISKCYQAVNIDLI
jgi:hypothetical protein